MWTVGICSSHLCMTVHFICVMVEEFELQSMKNSFIHKQHISTNKYKFSSYRVKPQDSINNASSKC